MHPGPFYWLDKLWQQCQCLAVFPADFAGRNSIAIPVLFLPGNAGSYKQVRSLAGETARRAARRHEAHAPQLHWFSADYREEHSALDGTILASLQLPVPELINPASCVLSHSP